jgi:hypothetical protein
MNCSHEQELDVMDFKLFQIACKVINYDILK